jgi:hypothetical protein
VVTRDVTACHATQQDQLFGTGVIDVWCSVHETLAQPPETYPGGPIPAAKVSRVLSRKAHSTMKGINH